MTELERSGIEVSRAFAVIRMLAFKGLLLCVFVHRKARMPEMERSGIEVILVFTGNERKAFRIYSRDSFSIIDTIKVWHFCYNFYDFYYPGKCILQQAVYFDRFYIQSDRFPGRKQ